jgi:hypothetical protein
MIDEQGLSGAVSQRLSWGTQVHGGRMEYV